MKELPKDIDYICPNCGRTLERVEGVKSLYYFDCPNCGKSYWFNTVNSMWYIWEEGIKHYNWIKILDSNLCPKSHKPFVFR